MNWLASLWRNLVFSGPPANLDVRVSGDSARAATTIREALRRAEPALVVADVVPMSARLARDVGRERIVAYLATGFASIALLLASLGLYGILTYAVTGRTREIGVRMALGAPRGEVVGLVVRDAARIVAVGVAAGLLAAAATGRWLTALLYDVSVSDPTTHVVVLLVLATVTVVAACLPARRGSIRSSRSTANEKEPRARETPSKNRRSGLISAASMLIAHCRPRSPFNEIDWNLPVHRLPASGPGMTRGAPAAARNLKRTERTAKSLRPLPVRRRGCAKPLRSG